jgi:hypothetical protein
MGNKNISENKTEGNKTEGKIKEFDYCVKCGENKQKNIFKLCFKCNREKKYLDNKESIDKKYLEDEKNHKNEKRKNNYFENYINREMKCIECQDSVSNVNHKYCSECYEREYEFKCVQCDEPNFNFKARCNYCLIQNKKVHYEKRKLTIDIKKKFKKLEKEKQELQRIEECKREGKDKVCNFCNFYTKYQLSLDKHNECQKHIKNVNLYFKNVKKL